MRDGEREERRELGGEGEHVLERFHRWRQPERFQRAAERHGECRATGRRREETAQRDSVSQRACVNDRIQVLLLPPQQVQHAHTTRRVSGVCQPPCLVSPPSLYPSLCRFSPPAPPSSPFSRGASYQVTGRPCDMGSGRTSPVRLSYRLTGATGAAGAGVVDTEVVEAEKARSAARGDAPKLRRRSSTSIIFKSMINQFQNLRFLILISDQSEHAYEGCQVPALPLRRAVPSCPGFTQEPPTIAAPAPPARRSCTAARCFQKLKWQWPKQLIQRNGELELMLTTWQYLSLRYSAHTTPHPPSLLAAGPWTAGTPLPHASWRSR